MSTFTARKWSDYIGQEDLKTKLDVYIKGAIRDRKMLPHVLLVAHPGFGKTTLAHIISQQMGDDMICFDGSVKMKVLARAVQGFGGGILFIDEIHRMSVTDQESMLTLLYEGYLELSTGRRIEHNALTVIGATTEPQKVIEPLWDRFPIKPSFAEYGDDDMANVVTGMATMASLHLNHGVAEQLGRATGGTPRMAERLVLAAGALHGPESIINVDHVAAILWQAGTDEDGLTDEHHLYIKVLFDFGGTAGLRNIMTMLHQPRTEVESTERLLLKKGLLLLEPSGRTLTPEGFVKASGVPVDILSRRRRTMGGE